MSSQKSKFQLFQRLQNLGFTYDEAVALRRIEMTLHRWAEAECNGEIERDEKTGKPFKRYGNYIEANDPRSIHFIADREAGALKRLKTLLDTRNEREQFTGRSSPYAIVPYHQTDPRGCALYLCTREQIGDGDISSIYTRGLAVCA